MEDEGPFGEETYPGAAAARSSPQSARVIDLEKHRAEASMARWQARLVKTDKHVVQPIVANALVLLGNLPSLSGLLGFNEFTNEPQLLRSPPAVDEGRGDMPGPYPRPWDKADVIALQAYFQRAWHPKWKKDVIEDAMLAHAYCHRFHPVRDWLETLTWDNKPRLDDWLERCFGAPPEESAAARETRRQIGAKFLIAAVRRVRDPGCKFDTTLVLEGNQGQGKSTALRTLFGARYFTDDLQDINTKEGAISLQGVWGVEVAELDRLLRTENETVKSFLSRQVDRYRPVYARAPAPFPRQCVLAGTTNRTDWLRDPTGNRRYWPVATTRADVAWLEANRDQLWAEAMVREAEGESIYLQDEDTQREMSEAQDARMSDDVWSETIADYLEDNPVREISIPQVLSLALNIAKERHDKRSEMRVALVMTMLGWTKRVAYARGSGTRRVWDPPPDYAERMEARAWRARGTTDSFGNPLL